MKFKSKRDRTFMGLMTGAIVLIAIATLWPVVYELFFTEKPDLVAITIMSALCLLTIGFLLWIVVDIEYTFQADYLLVRGGIFKSKIQYEDMTKVNHTSNIIAGYRILSSKDAIEIHYTKSLLGSVIISPERQEEFLNILLEKAPHINFVKK
ncbi:PH domain-containing protein [Psychrobacillus sp.]|uniref:PH domain-containing protein n=1 Tax=Psychrobacillus sp. TaxID=1871623 RepID=UPI0028BD6510|nr:PH domain-containing protein [Psychrobacillus sp.]